ncbi:MAG TPA: hypothetical protein EYP39_09700 [Ghiorsea sp.]|nr:hypothetical protein [Ghiorsea sp.]
MTKKKDIVWVSAAPMGGYIAKPFDNTIRMNDVSVSMELTKQNSAGISLPRESFPEEIYGLYSDKHFKKLPDLFNTHGYWVVSAATAEVLQRFDLGDGGLYPVKAFQHNRTKRIEGEYFCWNFGNVKKTYLPEESNNMRYPFGSDTRCTLGYARKDGDVVLTPEALILPDVWVEQNIESAFFLSDPLVQALRAAKVTRNFALKKCSIVEQS